jgi:hypothetical protein
MTPHARSTNDLNDPGSLYREYLSKTYPALSYPTTKKKYKFKRGYVTTNFYACGVIDAACTIFAFENRSYLGDFNAEFKKASARESGAQGVMFDEKKPRVENLVTLSL